jgi:signal transduction histidine kinase/CheY-like chemotaxis protein
MQTCLNAAPVRARWLLVARLLGRAVSIKRSGSDGKDLASMPANKLRRSLATTIAVPSILVAVATLILLWQLSLQRSETAWVEHTDNVMLLAQTAKADFLAAQTALRGFLISADPFDRAPLDADWKKSQEILRQLAALVGDNPPQEQRLMILEGLESQWWEAARAADPASKDDEKRTLARRAAATGSSVLAQFDEVGSSENQLRIIRDARRESLYRGGLLGVPLAALILVIGLTWAAWREIRNASAIFANALRTAEVANQAKTNFLGVISHELRNPLNSILLWCNVLQSTGKLEGKVNQGVNAISRAAKAQAQLIEDLLDVSRIESGQMRLDVQTVNLVEVVHAAVDGMSPAAEAKSIALQVVIDPRAGAITGDPQRLQQAIWNLLSNAIKFTPKEGKVQVRLERINSHLEITVSDSGQGIDKSALENVFDPFWQGTDRKTGDRGMGLGLSIVRHLVNLHGGTVSAHSDGLGKGSALVIRLPLPATTAGLVDPIRRHPTVAPVNQSSRAPRLENVSALVVDDDSKTRDGLSSLLTSLGAQVKAVETVESAIAVLSEMNPDVLISDLGMPGRDGYSLIREIRAQEKAIGTQQHLPVVALTAYGRVEDKVEIFSSGFDSHVVKPVDPAELAAVIRRLVEARRSSDRKQRIG